VYNGTALPLQLKLCKPIAHKSEAILSPIPDLKVFGPDTSHQMFVQNLSACECHHHQSIKQIIFVPTSTFRVQVNVL
jgi:hypothetical protein